MKRERIADMRRRLGNDTLVLDILEQAEGVQQMADAIGLERKAARGGQWQGPITKDVPLGPGFEERLKAALVQAIPQALGQAQAKGRGKVGLSDDEKPTAPVAPPAALSVAPSPEVTALAQAIANVLAALGIGQQPALAKKQRLGFWEWVGQTYGQQ